MLKKQASSKGRILAIPIVLNINYPGTEAGNQHLLLPYRILLQLLPRTVLLQLRINHEHVGLAIRSNTK